MTKREAILQAAISALSGVTGVPDSSIYRSRQEALQRQEFPAIIVEPVADSADQHDLARLMWNFTFHVAVCIRDDQPDEQADATIQSVHRKIMTDPTLNTICVDVLPVQTDWQLAQADIPLAVVTIQFRASYITVIDDISA